MLSAAECFTELSRWPEGNFALLSSIHGCPFTSAFPWKHAHVTFRRKPVSNGRNFQSSQNHFRGPSGEYEFSLHLCIKYELLNGNTQSQRKWPQGNYCIFAVDNQCPVGKKSLTNPLVSFNMSMNL